jgi:hypothetical protein
VAVDTGFAPFLTVSFDNSFSLLTGAENDLDGDQGADYDAWTRDEE